ncbi:hypothetical protein [Siccirubricoccus sp. G192]|uniref:hypothetical protein n=1 Tax=Siccirubricoccus sp. G192 TaxID=2849651 RepID=UPI001C2C30D8|nr:hypothetical protein [Siccirubricoccus sp. G192]MBV1800678.1 hypothetical protein [Siccirubricoccus sp. G192]
MSTTTSPKTHPAPEASPPKTLEEAARQLALSAAKGKFLDTVKGESQQAIAGFAVQQKSYELKHETLRTRWEQNERAVKDLRGKLIHQFGDWKELLCKTVCQTKDEIEAAEIALGKKSEAVELPLQRQIQEADGERQAAKERFTSWSKAADTLEKALTETAAEIQQVVQLLGKPEKVFALYRFWVRLQPAHYAVAASKEWALFQNGEVSTGKAPWEAICANCREEGGSGTGQDRGNMPAEKANSGAGVSSRNKDTAATPAFHNFGDLHVEAKDPCAGGRRIWVKIEDSTTKVPDPASPGTSIPVGVRVKVAYWSEEPQNGVFDPFAEPCREPRPTQKPEDFDNVVIADETSPDHFAKRVNENSALVKLSILDGANSPPQVVREERWLDQGGNANGGATPARAAHLIPKDQLDATLMQALETYREAGLKHAEKLAQSRSPRPILLLQRRS